MGDRRENYLPCPSPLGGGALTRGRRAPVADRCERGPGFCVLRSDRQPVVPADAPHGRDDEPRGGALPKGGRRPRVHSFRPRLRARSFHPDGDSRAASLRILGRERPVPYPEWAREKKADSDPDQPLEIAEDVRSLRAWGVVGFRHFEEGNHGNHGMAGLTFTGKSDIDGDRDRPRSPGRSDSRAGACAAE